MVASITVQGDERFMSDPITQNLHSCLSNCYLAPCLFCRALKPPQLRLGSSLSHLSHPHCSRQPPPSHSSALCISHNSSPSTLPVSRKRRPRLPAPVTPGPPPSHPPLPLLGMHHQPPICPLPGQLHSPPLISLQLAQPPLQPPQPQPQPPQPLPPWPSLRCPWQMPSPAL